MYFKVEIQENVSSSDFEEQKIVSRTNLEAKVFILDTNFSHFNRKTYSN